MTGRDLISAALRKIGAIASGEAASAPEVVDGLSELNRMLSSWSNENLMVYSETEEVFSLVPSQQSYTMGVGGNFNTSRPTEIKLAKLRVLGTSPAIDIPIDIVNESEWASITQKTLPADYPSKLYVDGGYPLLTLKLWTVPTSAHQIVLYSVKELSSIANANATISLPAGYEDALVYNLAVRLSPEYGKAVSADIATIANESKSAIKNKNRRPLYLRVDSGLRSSPRTFNWISGE